MYGERESPRVKNIRELLERQGIEPSQAVYIGDTQGDLDAADMAKVQFIHAAYGFGSVSRKTAVLSSIKDLPDILASCTYNMVCLTIAGTPFVLIFTLILQSRGSA
jgi:phosphoglycolate phosphatase